MFQTLQTQAEGSIGRLQLDRPDKLNPLSTQTLTEIAEAARWFDEQSEVKVVIVGGSGRSFPQEPTYRPFQARASRVGSPPVRPLNAAAPWQTLLKE